MSERTFLELRPEEWEAIGVWVGSIFAVAAFVFLIHDQKSSRNAILSLARLAKAEEKKQLAFFQIVKGSERIIGNAIKIQLINKGGRAIHCFILSRNASVMKILYSFGFDNNIETGAVIELTFQTYDGTPLPIQNRAATISFLDINNKQYEQTLVLIERGLSFIIAPFPEEESKNAHKKKSWLKPFSYFSLHRN